MKGLFREEGLLISCVWVQGQCKGFYSFRGTRGYAGLQGVRFEPKCCRALGIRGSGVCLV